MDIPFENPWSENSPIGELYEQWWNAEEENIYLLNDYSTSMLQEFEMIAKSEFEVMRRSPLEWRRADAQDVYHFLGDIRKTLGSRIGE